MKVKIEDAMKRRLFFFISVLVMVMVSGLVLIESHASTQHKLAIRLVPAKEVYTLGEAFEAELIIKNHGRSEVVLRGANVQSGYVKILISQDGRQYRMYTYPGMSEAGKGTVLKSNESLTRKQTVLSNAIPPTQHLNETSRLEVTNSKLVTPYAFQEPVTYYIKAVLYLPQAPAANADETAPQVRNVNDMIVIESEPVVISVVAPSGVDKEVWEKIKDRSDIAYFMQMGEIGDAKKEDSFVLEIETILSKYPRSSCSLSLRRSLDTFRVSEEKRIKYLKMVKEEN